MSEKSKRGILPLLGIILFTFLLLTGTATAASNPDNFKFDISEGDIIVEKGTDANTIKITYDSGTSKDNVNINQMITIFDTKKDENTGPDATNFIVIVDGNGIKDEIQITIENVNISGVTKSAFSLQNDSKVNLILNGDNILTGGTGTNGIGMPGIEVPEGCELTITSINGGSLTVKGGGGSSGGGGGGGGGAGIGSGGGSVGIITIEDNCEITATGGSGGGVGGIGSGIGSGGGGAGTGGNGIGGPVSSIEISGPETDIIITRGGIGMGAPGNRGTNKGEANVIIESGNVLILDQPESANAVFKNSAGSPVFPISFSVMDDNVKENKLSGVHVSADSYNAMTRGDTADRLDGFTINPSEKESWCEKGTVTMWLPVPVSPTDEVPFTFEKDQDSQTYNGTIINQRDNTIGDPFIPIYLKIIEPATPPNNGGNGFGEAKVLNNTDVTKNSNESKTPSQTDQSQNNQNEGFDNEKNEQDNSQQNEPVKMPGIVWIVIGGIVLVVGGAGVYFYQKNK